MIETTQKDTKQLVPTKYFDVFTFRLMGLTYEQIAAKTGYSSDWIRHMFSKGGVLQQLWLNWLQSAKAESIDEAITMMFGHLPDVVRARIVHAKGQDKGAVESSKMIFKHTLDKDDDSDILRSRPSTLSDARKLMIINAFLNFKVLNAKSDTNNPDGGRDNSESGATS